ncbi:hypothetical protein K9N68_20905 [Kovacikia minuta CCNUW1]|nr:hypothetical protein K9N68_20905 [Kovacikia minuta CCNUW1]
MDVVDVDIVAEDLFGVLVGGFDRGAGKADEGGVGQYQMTMRVADK